MNPPYGEMNPPYGMNGYHQQTQHPPPQNGFQQMIQRQRMANGGGFPPRPPPMIHHLPPPQHHHQMYYPPPPQYHHPYPQQQLQPYYPQAPQYHHYQQPQPYYAPPPSNPTVFECKTCNKSYPSAKQLQAHLKSHQKCPHCENFSAMGRVLKEHIRDEHGISPEPKLPNSLRQLIPKKYLHVHKQDFSEENLKRWIAERKRKYPTKENVEKKKKLKQDLPEKDPKCETTTRKRGRKLCKYFMKGTCKQGKNCKFEHDESIKVIRQEKKKRRKLDGNKGLLKALLQKDIGREHEILLQAIRHLVRETDLFNT